MGCRKVLKEFSIIAKKSSSLKLRGLKFEEQVSGTALKRHMQMWIFRYYSKTSLKVK